MIMLELTYNKAASACRQWAAVESRPTEATQICGVQYSIPNRFLTGTPKQLEIAVTRTKQNTEVISNRDTNTTPSNAFSRSTLTGLSQRQLSRAAPIPNQQTLSLSPPYRARQTPFLIVTPKRLEIAVTHRKQNIEVISNRNKIGHLRNAIVGPSWHDCNRSAGILPAFVGDVQGARVA
jgi:hypothetical protein